jgi:hypothetical protein
LLRGDAGRSATAVREGVTVPLNQQQFDALVSFTFNVGTGAFSGSTLLTRLNAGEYDAVRRTSGPAIPGPRDVARHELRGEWMATNRPDPGEFLELAQRMLRELFGDSRSDDDPWAEATRRHRERSDAPQGDREPSAERQRENLTFALATRAVEALEDLALNVAAIRQRLERTSTGTDGPRADEDDATGQ